MALEGHRGEESLGHDGAAWYGMASVRVTTGFSGLILTPTHHIILQSSSIFGISDRISLIYNYIDEKLLVLLSQLEKMEGYPYSIIWMRRCLKSDPLF